MVTVAEPADIRRQVRRAERRRRRLAVLLVAPLALFLLLTFIAPIMEMLRRSVVDTDLRSTWPRTVAALADWDGKDLPPEAAFAALGQDMKESVAARTAAVVARRLNYADPGARTLIMTTGRKVAGLDAPPPSWRKAFVGIDPAWGERRTWAMLRQASGPLTSFYTLYALDLRRDADGSIVAAPANEAIFVDILLRTLSIAGLVTVICAVLGFPVAYLLANAPARAGNLLLILVLVPFWTSLLVRIAAWFVLLQDQGLVNEALVALGVVEKPLRLIYNRTGVIIAMVHVLLPFMIMPLYGVMKTVPPQLYRASLSLGAPPTTSFLRVYLPQTKPGIFAGILLVFIMSVGYYITPALVGGANDQMISWFIAFYTTDTANWGLAAALGLVLLVATGVLYAAYQRLSGARGVAFG
ncbi:ABC transporter permease [Vineibacter terrae]|uniref:ABC transporter permease n=1 Tax=Vineibacter terrae TaxID=2586908 RepID=UPI002E33091E|nr:ABC transporter permease [Vineibacter terrae]HEX2890232.1 ABC transporter permease [Vineibacter terrae]